MSKPCSPGGLATITMWYVISMAPREGFWSRRRLDVVIKYSDGILIQSTLQRVDVVQILVVTYIRMDRIIFRVGRRGIVNCMDEMCAMVIGDVRLMGGVVGQGDGCLVRTVRISEKATCVIIVNKI